MDHALVDHRVKIEVWDCPSIPDTKIARVSFADP